MSNEKRAEEWFDSHLPRFYDFGELRRRYVADLKAEFDAVEREAREARDKEWRDALFPGNEDTGLGRECLDPNFAAGVLKESANYIRDQGIWELGSAEGMEEKDIKRFIESLPGGSHD